MTFDDKEVFGEAEVNFADLDDFDDLEDTDAGATGSLSEVGLGGAMGGDKMPMPIDFQALSAAEYKQEITDLRVWVAWFVEVMFIEAKTIPPCWEQHTDIVMILSALERHYSAAHHPASAPVEPSSFHQYAVPNLLAKCEAAHACGFGTHKTAKVQPWAADINARGYEARSWQDAESVLEDEYSRRVSVEATKASLHVIPGDSQ